jgi:hypothetical protein
MHPEPKKKFWHLENLQSELRLQAVSGLLCHELMLLVRADVSSHTRVVQECGRFRNEVGGTKYPSR